MRGVRWRLCGKFMKLSRLRDYSARSFRALELVLFGSAGSGILTELQLGSYLLMDWQFKERMGDLFEVALTVLATVISTSENHFVIDVGLKGLGNKGGAPRLLGHLHYEVTQWAAEEHTVIMAHQHKIRVGDLVRVLPSHASGTVNLYRNLNLHDGELIIERWPISATGYPFEE